MSGLAWLGYYAAATSTRVAGGVTNAPARATHVARGTASDQGTSRGQNHNRTHRPLQSPAVTKILQATHEAPPSPWSKDRQLRSIRNAIESHIRGSTWNTCCADPLVLQRASAVARVSGCRSSCEGKTKWARRCGARPAVIWQCDPRVTQGWRKGSSSTASASRHASPRA